MFTDLVDILKELECIEKDDIENLTRYLRVSRQYFSDKVL